MVFVAIAVGCRRRPSRTMFATDGEYLGGALTALRGDRSPIISSRQTDAGSSRRHAEYLFGGPTSRQSELHAGGSRRTIYYRWAMSRTMGRLWSPFPDCLLTWPSRPAIIRRVAERLTGSILSLPTA
jgi:hypothetical protein